MNRRKAREQAFCLLYSLQFNDTVQVVEAIDNILEEETFEELSFEEDPFFRLLVNGTMEHLDALDHRIEAHSLHWAKERISKVSLAILRLCVFEMQYGGTEVKIAINEAVELAKKYEGKEGASFINGVLGGIVKRPEEGTSPIESPTNQEAECPVEAPAETSVENATECSIESPAETPVEDAIERPLESPAEIPVEDATECPIESPAETSVENATGCSIESPAETPVENSIESPEERSTESPTENPAESPVESPAEES